MYLYGYFIYEFIYIGGRLRVMYVIYIKKKYIEYVEY